MAKILITGGTGMIGKSLTNLFLAEGHKVVHLSRSVPENPQVPTYLWNIEKKEIDLQAFDGVDTIVHLAGSEIVDQKWTKEWKQVIIDSRVKSAELLYNTCQANDIQLEQFVSASGISWYQDEDFDVLLDETAPSGKGFLAEVCVEWEKAADQFGFCASKVCKLRIGLVLQQGVGVLKMIEPLINMFLGAGVGTGLQATNWIHMDDVCRMFEHLVENRLSGIYNAVGPEPTTNQEFIQTLADAMERAIFFPNIPEFIISSLYGEKAQLVLKGSKISSKKIEETGFVFDYPTMNTALLNIYSS